MNEIATLNNLVTEIKFFENQAVTSYWEIGKRLSQAKEQVERGDWLNWVDENLGYSERTTQQLIKVYTTFPNANMVSDLKFRQVLALTSIDEETRNEILENENLEDKTVKETEEIVKKYKKVKEDNEELEKKTQELEIENQLLYDELKKSSKKEVVEKTITKEVIKEVLPNDYEAIKRENKILQDKNRKLELDYKASKFNDNEENEKLKSELRNYKWLVINFVKNTTPLLNIIDQIKLLPKEEQQLLMKSTENLLGFANNLYEQMKGL